MTANSFNKMNVSKSQFSYCWFSKFEAKKKHQVKLNFVCWYIVQSIFFLTFLIFSIFHFKSVKKTKHLCHTLLCLRNTISQKSSTVFHCNKFFESLCTIIFYSLAYMNIINLYNIFYQTAAFLKLFQEKKNENKKRTLTNTFLLNW